MATTGQVAVPASGGNAGHRKRDNARLVLTVVVAFVLMALDSVTPLGLTISLLQILVIWTATLWAGRRQIVWLAGLCSSLIVFGFLLSSKTGLENGVAIGNVLLSVGAVWAIAQTSLRQKATEEARRKAAEDLAKSEATVAVLTGILPICASCKKIRNESGSWEQIEAYITNHSAAQFSHGLCGPCMIRLYPEFMQKSEQSEKAG